jgi:glycosyltransferase involved in cell wall biosynthesis
MNSSSFVTASAEQASEPQVLEVWESSRPIDAPEVSIVVPALNEQITIGEFVDWCWEGIRNAGVSGEVIIVDSSSDETPRIAHQRGARVVRTPRRGLGQAYIDALPFVRGKFVILGDCDLTYDFRNLKPFIDAFRSGAEFVMGSRFKGTIEPGAMPRLHRYFGTPLTTWILNRIYRSSYTDIHCGMRGLTLDAIRRIQLASSGWEYASEMVLKAARLRLRVCEVPVTFFKDREGRLSHHRRSGFWSPWIAGWINLKVMLIYSPDSFLVKPGLVLALLGSMISTALVFGPRSIGPIGFDLHWMLLGLAMTVLGFALFQVGVIARLIHGLRSGVERFVLSRLTYNRGMTVSLSLLTAGTVIEIDFLHRYLEFGLKLERISHPSVFGLLLIVLAAQVFGFTLLLELGRRARFISPNLS